MRYRASYGVAIALVMCLPVLTVASSHHSGGWNWTSAGWPEGQHYRQAASPKVFSSKSEVVMVHVTVRDHKSRLVAGLPREAFSIFENGQPQTLTYFENEDRPVTVGLVLDSSGSMQRKRDDVIAAGLAFAKSSHPEDEMFTVNFNEHVWEGLPPSLPFTTDFEELRRALLRSGARGETALFDAVDTALHHLDEGHEEKKVLIVVSDGGDNASKTTYANVLDKALRMDAVLYGVGIYDEYSPDTKPELLKKLADSTGGAAFFPKNASEATTILERIAEEIRSGYTLGYAPAAGASGYRAIRVAVNPQDKRKLNVRARSGYVAGATNASR
jgi:Ca-activated chloride channel family protein